MADPVAHRTGPGELSLGEIGSETDFAMSCSNIRLSPNTSSGDQVATLGGGTISDGNTTAWTLAGTLYQGFRKDDLIRWCFDNRDKVVPFRFTPSNEHSDYDWRGRLTIVPLEVGGEVRKRNTSDFEFSVEGDPEAVDLASAAAQIPAYDPATAAAYAGPAAARASAPAVVPGQDIDPEPAPVAGGPALAETDG